LKSRGPRTDPWGTPVSTEQVSDLKPHIETKWDLNQFKTVPETPNTLSRWASNRL